MWDLVEYAVTAVAAPRGGHCDRDAVPVCLDLSDIGTRGLYHIYYMYISFDLCFL